MSDTRHETYDVDFFGVLRFAVVLIVAGVIVAGIVWLLFSYLLRRDARQGPVEYPLAVQEQNRLPPEPRLQTNPRQDLEDFRAQEDSLLKSYGWIDRNAGTVRIPIDEAMKLTLQRGLAARPESAGSK
jgi:hypothetical protein